MTKQRADQTILDLRTGRRHVASKAGALGSRSHLLRSDREIARAMKACADYHRHQRAMARVQRALGVYERAFGAIPRVEIESADYALTA